VAAWPRLGGLFPAAAASKSLAQGFRRRVKSLGPGSGSGYVAELEVLSHACLCRGSEPLECREEGATTLLKPQRLCHFLHSGLASDSVGILPALQGAALEEALCLFCMTLLERIFKISEQKLPTEKRAGLKNASRLSHRVLNSSGNKTSATLAPYRRRLEYSRGICCSKSDSICGDSDYSGLSGVWAMRLGY